MDYIQEYVQVLKTRISDLEIQVAILRSLLPNPPSPPPPGAKALQPIETVPEVKPKHLSLVQDVKI